VVEKVAGVLVWLKTPMPLTVLPCLILASGFKV
jgi:hypothetical protein